MTPLSAHVCATGPRSSRAGARPWIPFDPHQRPQQFAHAIEPYLKRIVGLLVEHREHKTLVFLPLIALSQRFAELCYERGLRSALVDGSRQNWRGILAQVRRIETRVSNYDKQYH